MEITLTYLFYTLFVWVVLLTIITVFKIKIPYKDIIFDLSKYGVLILISSIIILYDKIVLGLSTFVFGLFISLVLKNKK